MSVIENDIYTWKEKHVANWSVQLAVDNAKSRLRKHGIYETNLTCLGNKKMSDRISLQESNELADRIYYDTIECL